MNIILHLVSRDAAKFSDLKDVALGETFLTTNLVLRIGLLLRLLDSLVVDVDTPIRRSISRVGGLTSLKKRIILETNILVTIRSYTTLRSVDENVKIE